MSTSELNDLDANVIFHLLCDQTVDCGANAGDELAVL
jgi:hypothetical protein